MKVKTQQIATVSKHTAANSGFTCTFPAYLSLSKTLWSDCIHPFRRPTDPKPWLAGPGSTYAALRCKTVNAPSLTRPQCQPYSGQNVMSKIIRRDASNEKQRSAVHELRQTVAGHSRVTVQQRPCGVRTGAWPHCLLHGAEREGGARPGGAATLPRPALRPGL